MLGCNVTLFSGIIIKSISKKKKKYLLSLSKCPHFEQEIKLVVLKLFGLNYLTLLKIN